MPENDINKKIQELESEISNYKEIIRRRDEADEKSKKRRNWVIGKTSSVFLG